MVLTKGTPCELSPVFAFFCASSFATGQPTDQVVFRGSAAFPPISRVPRPSNLFFRLVRSPSNFNQFRLYLSCLLATSYHWLEFALTNRCQRSTHGGSDGNVRKILQWLTIIIGSPLSSDLLISKEMATGTYYIHLTGGPPWGFRLAGGYENLEPIRISKVS